jgi:hypothetical protein
MSASEDDPRKLPCSHNCLLTSAKASEKVSDASCPSKLIAGRCPLPLVAFADGQGA